MVHPVFGFFSRGWASVAVLAQGLYATDPCTTPTHPLFFPKPRLRRRGRQKPCRGFSAIKSYCIQRCPLHGTWPWACVLLRSIATGASSEWSVQMSPRRVLVGFVFWYRCAVYRQATTRCFICCSWSRAPGVPAQGHDVLIIMTNDSFCRVWRD